MKSGRVTGSCRFEPYWKAEVWDAMLACWRPIQRAVASEEDARKLVKAGKTGRILAISESGTQVGEAFIGGV